MKHKKTEWEGPIANWYDKEVGKEGHYYHQHLIFPALKRLIPFEKAKILDMACGQGVLEHVVPSTTPYTGVDLSEALIKAAKSRKLPSGHRFLVGDITGPLSLDDDFTHVVIILALQNLHKPLEVLKNAYKYLQKGGKLLIVLNHPCFRIPRQSSWGIDSVKKIQYRRIDRYLSPLEIPIQIHPGKQQKSPSSWTFHFSLGTLCGWLKETGFFIETMEEWCSDKTSEGGAAQRENRARKEFPLFLAVVADKIF